MHYSNIIFFNSIIQYVLRTGQLTLMATDHYFRQATAIINNVVQNVTLTFKLKHQSHSADILSHWPTCIRKGEKIW